MELSDPQICSNLSTPQKIVTNKYWHLQQQNREARDYEVHLPHFWVFQLRHGYESNIWCPDDTLKYLGFMVVDAPNFWNFKRFWSIPVSTIQVNVDFAQFQHQIKTVVPL